MIDVCIVGVGKWGLNYLKLADKLGINFIIANRFNWKEIINSKKCQGVIITTPPDSHVEIAIESLKNNLPVMIEKPLALNSDDALKLKKYENHAPILINHLHLFAPAYEYICKNILPEDIVKIKSIGCNNGPYRNYSSLLDYGPHDFAMGAFLLQTNDLPEVDFFSEITNNNSKNFELNIKYFEKIPHHITVGNAGPEKIRLFEVKTIKNNIFIYNDMSNNKLLLDNKIITVGNISPLENSLNSFIKSFNGYIDNRFGLDIGINFLKIFEQCKV